MLLTLVTAVLYYRVLYTAPAELKISLQKLTWNFQLTRYSLYSRETKSWQSGIEFRIDPSSFFQNVNAMQLIFARNEITLFKEGLYDPE